MQAGNPHLISFKFMDRLSFFHKNHSIFLVKTMRSGKPSFGSTTGGKILLNLIESGSCR